MDAMQKIFLIEDTEVRQTAQGKTYGAVLALAKQPATGSSTKYTFLASLQLNLPHQRTNSF